MARWVDAIERNEGVKATTSGEELYLDSYERYAGKLEFSSVHEGQQLIRGVGVWFREPAGYQPASESSEFWDGLALKVGSVFPKLRWIIYNQRVRWYLINSPSIQLRGGGTRQFSSLSLYSFPFLHFFWE